MQRKAFVLLSGGMDSTTCLYKAIYDFSPLERGKGDHLGMLDWVEAVSIDYGQRHQKEIEYAKRTCDALAINHTILDVGNLLSGKSVMLSRESLDSVQIPNISYEEIKGVSPSYVPFRNGLLLSAITAHAQKWVNEQIDKADAILHDKEHATASAKDLAGIYWGPHSEDAANWAYPDCTPEFIGSMANAIYIGSYQTIRLYTPLQWLMKNEIVTLGSRLGVDFARTWSCYAGEELHCGVCPTCRSRKAAFIEAGVKDPTDYKEHNYWWDDTKDVVGPKTAAAIAAMNEGKKS